MLVHVRLSVPKSLVEPVRTLLLDSPGVTNLTFLPGASLNPAGDVLEADVAREIASDLLDRLTELGLPESGGVTLSALTATPFKAARRIEKAVEGDPDDAVIWGVIKDQAYDAVRPTATYLTFLILAVMLASIAVITDSAILVVGAMVVGPEFATVAAICTGILFRRTDLIIKGFRLLLFGFALAILIVAVLGYVGHLTGLISTDMVTRDRPQTGFIWHPDRWSFIVALLAGAAGVIALSADKAQTMVGVFISVTTVPAAGNLALGLAVGSGSEMRGSALQLLVNITGMIVAGTLTLLIQRLAWDRISKTSKGLRPPDPVRGR